MIHPDIPVKALSIQQPWAWLIVNGHKDIENRDWRTNFRGPVAIHAGKKIETYQTLHKQYPQRGGHYRALVTSQLRVAA